MVNKYFRPAGGAESVFFQTTSLLRDAGVSVAEFAMADPENVPTPWAPFFAPQRTYRDGKVWPRLRDGAAAVYSPAARRSLRALVQRFEPDVAHLHNVYHQLSLSIIDELVASRIPIVMTVHDYKPVCPNYTLLAHDGPCMRCVGGKYWNAAVHRCTKGSVAGSALASGEAYLNRFRRQYEKVDHYIVPSDFSRRVLIRGNFDARKITVIRNAVDARPPHKKSEEPARFVYCGRLAPEKGLRTLLAASSKLRDAVVEVYGDGPLRSDIAEQVAVRKLPIKLRGRIAPTEVPSSLVGARAALLPSDCYESGARAITEAGAMAVPTIASDRGASVELIAPGRDGLLFEAGSAEGLSAAMTSLIASPEDANRMGLAAWQRVSRDHRPSDYCNAIQSIYELCTGREAA